MSHLTGHERTFEPSEIIVSKTDTKGRITYANQVFQRVAGYTEAELLGKPHSIVRHPDMPRCVFKYLWDTIAAGREVFAYVLNRAKCGDHYWVFAHVTPSFDRSGRVVGYHSNRRVPYPDALGKVKDLYARMLAEEKRHGDYHSGMAAATRILTDLLASRGQTYSEFVFGLSERTRLERRAA